MKKKKFHVDLNFILSGYNDIRRKYDIHRQTYIYRCNRFVLFYGKQALTSVVKSIFREHNQCYTHYNLKAKEKSLPFPRAITLFLFRNAEIEKLKLN